MKFEVQTQFTYGWENCWHSDGVLVKFASRAEAEKELAEYIEEGLQAVKDGDLEDFEPSDYRVAECDIIL